MKFSTFFILYLVILSSLHSQAPLSVIMSEINFDPIGDDDKKEWIKLTNLSSESADVSDYSLAWGIDVYGCLGYVQIPYGTIIEGYESLIIGGPISNEDNGYPCINIPIDFDLNLPNDSGLGGGVAVGISLYNRGPDFLDRGLCFNYFSDPNRPPIHSFVYNGNVNNGLLYDRNGDIKEVDIVDVGAEGNEAIYFLFGQSWQVETNIGPQGSCNCDWYKDLDGDLIGGEYISSSCKRPAYCIDNTCSNIGGDCDDDNFGVSGYSTFYYDSDGDGHYGGDGRVICGRAFCAIIPCANFKDDCDDNDPTTYFNCAGMSSCNHSDFNSLMEIYFKLNGPAWVNNEGWIDGASANDCDPCNGWFGVTCVNDRVVGLNLAANNLSGSLPSELGDLSYLTWLFLNDNNLQGKIPNTIGQLTDLINVRLQNNNLTGYIPSSIGNNKDLRFLFLNSNQLTSTIPKSLGELSDIQILNLSNNNLEGCYPSSFYNKCQIINTIGNPSLPDEGNMNLSFCNTGEGSCCTFYSSGIEGDPLNPAGLYSSKEIVINAILQDEAAQYLFRAENSLIVNINDALTIPQSTEVAIILGNCTPNPDD